MIRSCDRGARRINVPTVEVVDLRGYLSKYMKNSGIPPSPYSIHLVDVPSQSESCSKRRACWENSYKRHLLMDASVETSNKKIIDPVTPSVDTNSDATSEVAECQLQVGNSIDGTQYTVSLGSNAYVTLFIHETIVSGNYSALHLTYFLVYEQRRGARTSDCNRSTLRHSGNGTNHLMWPTLHSPRCTQSHRCVWTSSGELFACLSAFEMHADAFLLCRLTSGSLYMIEGFFHQKSWLLPTHDFYPTTMAKVCSLSIIHQYSLLLIV